MQIHKLKNKLTLAFLKRPSNSVTINITIKTGSNHENSKEKGISHFIEHLLFEGTKTRTQKQIASEIEKIGGELNAQTSNESTTYYAIIPKKHFKKALIILSDLIQNPLFKDSKIENERKIILNEMKQTIDQPRFYQWILFHKHLFKKHPAKYPISGYPFTVKKITKEQILNYYQTYYIPNNTIISIVGNIKDPKHLVEEYFTFQPKKLKTKKFKKEKNLKQTKTEKRKIQHSYLVLGYKTPSRKSKASYALDIIKYYLGYGQSSKLFEEIREKYGLVYEIGAYYEANIDYGFFAIYLSTDKKNIKKVTQIILKELNNLQNITKKELQQTKEQIEGQFLLKTEDKHFLADLLTYYIELNKSKIDYIKQIKSITLKDIKKISKKYLNNNYTLTILKQK